MRWVFVLSCKLLFTAKTLKQSSVWFAVLGMAFGVACLVVSMSVMGGFEATLKKTMTDVTGHLVVVQRSMDDSKSEVLQEKIKQLLPSYVASLPFVKVEGLVAQADKGVSGVILQGVAAEELNQVLSLQGRLIQGRLDLKNQDNEKVKAVIGKGLAQSFDLQVGQDFKVILPIADPYQAQGFRRKIIQLNVTGIVDVGTHDWNQRLIITDIQALQVAADMGPQFLGLLVKLSHPDLALAGARVLSEGLGVGYFVTHWRELNQNLFDAVAIEKPTIFLIVLLLEIVAAFNISSYLFVHVLRRYPDISILKTLGLSQKKIQWLFLFQGLLLGGVGLVLGFALGKLFSWAFLYLQSHWGVIDGAVYRLDHIQTQLGIWDFIIISVFTLVICAMATVAPARRGARLNPVQGLRYD
ncbi:MAG: FtsX-like permease family protein [Pseudobdellovibrionaceae bacterium]